MFQVNKHQMQKALDGSDPLTFERLLVGMHKLDPKWRENLATSGLFREALRYASVPISDSLHPYMPDGLWQKIVAEAFEGGKGIEALNLT